MENILGVIGEIAAIKVLLILLCRAKSRDLSWLSKTLSCNDHASRQRRCSSFMRIALIA